MSASNRINVEELRIGKINGLHDLHRIIYDSRTDIHDVRGNVVIECEDEERVTIREIGRNERYVFDQYMRHAGNRINELQNALQRSEEARRENEERMRRNVAGRHRGNGRTGRGRGRERRGDY